MKRIAAATFLLIALATPAGANHPPGDPPNGPSVITGTPGDDVLAGGHGPDVLIGKGGRDRLWGGRGPDSFHCGPGFDTVFNRRGTGNDYIDADCEVVKT